MLKSGSILLLACYELGHQPLSLAWPLAALAEAGFAARAVDLAVESFPHDEAARAQVVAISVPMHTALRLGVQAATQVRAANPAAHICFYGLYAWLNADYLLDGIADSVIAGEYEQPLVNLLKVLEKGGEVATVAGVSTPGRRARPYLARLQFPLPQRTTLPSLSKYARYQDSRGYHLAGYVETSRGCLHTCRHCPVVPVYNGRFFVIPAEQVLADIRQQVAAGAQHITFGDPDFLNGPGHSLKIARLLHAEFPRLTFNFTTKVEHILKHRHLFAELRRLGAAFVVSAFESVSDNVLERLKKGHTAADLEVALDILGAAKLPVQPTWVAFTPWTTLDDYLNMLAWIRLHGLITSVPAVQLSVRLLVPPGSALLGQPESHTWLGPLDAANFTYCWQHPDSRLDWLQQQVALLAERRGNDDPYATFAAVEELASSLTGRPAPHWRPSQEPAPAPPRLTEDWFC